MEKLPYEIKKYIAELTCNITKRHIVPCINRTFNKITQELPFLGKYNRKSFIIYLITHSETSDLSSLSKFHVRFHKKEICDLVASSGRLDIFKYVRECGYPWTEFTPEYACRNDHTDIVKYICENGGYYETYLWELALNRGNLELIKLHDKLIGIRQWFPIAFAHAAEKGHLNVVKYFHETGNLWDARVCEYATKYGHPDIVQYAHDNGCPCDCLR